jgi:hypothetical protein
MVRNRKSWREATIISRLDPNHWRAEYQGGGSGMFREADIRAYDAERDARPASLDPTLPLRPRARGHSSASKRTGRARRETQDSRP